VNFLETAQKIFVELINSLTEEQHLLLIKLFVRERIKVERMEEVEEVGC